MTPKIPFLQFNIVVYKYNDQGNFYSTGTDTLDITEGTSDSTTYYEILKKNKSLPAKFLKLLRTCIFQQNNDSTYTAMKMIEYVQVKKIRFQSGLVSQLT